MSELVAAFGAPWLVGRLLLSVRLAALILVTPLLYAFHMPASIRSVLVLALSFAIALPLAVDVQLHSSSFGALLAAAACEAAIGATLGLGISMAFAGFAMAGRLLDMQVGFGIGQIFDPATRSQVPVLTSLFSLLGVLLFFLADGHHALLRGVAYSLTAFPLGQPWPIGQLADVVLRQAAGLFTLGIALAAPVLLALLLLEVAPGVVARNLPQMNMFVMGIPVKIIAGLGFLSLWIVGIAPVSSRLFTQIVEVWANLFQAATPPGVLR